MRPAFDDKPGGKIFRNGRGISVATASEGARQYGDFERKNEPRGRLSLRPRLAGSRFPTVCFLLLFALIGGLSFRTFSQEQPTEYQVKAAFLYNFAKFVEWPPETFADTNSPMVLGILGRNVFGNDLEKTIRDRKVNNHLFQFKNFTSAAEATNCHILFISASEKDNFAKIIAGLHNASVLTVSEADGFIKAGGMINFTVEDTKIRFEISDEAAKKAGLKISSKLLSLAVPGH